VNASLALRLSPLVLAVLATPTFAQHVPGGGQLLQQVPTAPTRPALPPALTVQTSDATSAKDDTPFAVTRIRIEGNALVTTTTLHDLVADGEGGTQTLTSLQALAQRITDYYRAHGHLLARAYVPAQTLSDGTVTLAVLEARYGQVPLSNHSRVDDSLLRATLAPLQAGAPVTQPQLDRQLLLLDDLPGVQGHALLRPGAAPGRSDLVVDAQALPPVSGNLMLDDGGDRYTGRVRLGGNVAINNLAGLGDRLGASLLTSGRDMRYGRLGYDMALNGAGTRLGLEHSVLAYRLGNGLSDLHAHGTAAQSGVRLSQALIRRPDTRLDGQLALDHRRLRDDIDNVGARNHRHIWDWTVSLAFDHRDNRGGGGLTHAQASVTRGQLGFDDPAARAADAASAGTRGHYLRWNGSVSRLQALTGRLHLYASLDGQYSHHNLDSAEQFLLGGMGSARGYEASTLAGASGYLATLELRRDLSLPAGQWQASVFVDHGGLWINPQHWTGMSGANHATLSSAGLGLAWAGPSQWTARLQLGQPVGDTPQLAGKRPSTRAWLQLGKEF